MKDQTRISDLGKHVGHEVTLYGWVHNTRFSGKIGFVILRDGSGLCQCVLEKNEASAEAFDRAKHVGQESALRIRGTVHADERATGGHELKITDLTVMHEATDYPITPKPHGVDFLMKHRHLWFRSQRQHALLRIRATVIDAIRSFLNDNGYVLIDTPIFSGSAGEGTSTLFSVDYFGEPVYLAQTGQLHVEAACMAHGKVYCFGPTFRAEKSKTRRHLTEFWMVEPEIAFADLDEVIDAAEGLVAAIVTRVLDDHRAELETIGRDLAPLEVLRKPFYRMTYSAAVEILRGPVAREMLEKDLVAKKAAVEALDGQIAEQEELAKTARKKWQQEKAAQQAQAARMERAELQEQVENIPQHLELAANFEWGGDLGGSDETILSRLHDRPVFVTHYPAAVKAFYMRVDRSNGDLVENFDLLAPEGFGEIIGGSAREEDHDLLLQRIKDHNLPVEPYEWYLDLRRFGSVPHGGFGLGVERTVAWLCGLKHIRETIPYPRLRDKVYP
ncbi:MAG: asparagine--tRNA ligase [bacterium]|nr:asparagine--tRNA ligase [bacterium]